MKYFWIITICLSFSAALQAQQEPQNQPLELDQKSIAKEELPKKDSELIKKKRRIERRKRLALIRRARTRLATDKNH